MRAFFLIFSALLAACAPAPAPVPKPPPDPTTAAWYGPVTAQLASMNRQAEARLREGKSDPAAALITQGQPLSLRLLAAPHPTLAAMEAASDLDHLYATMLLGNQNYVWARLAFQKNVSRWKNWRPQTPDTARRLKSAQPATEAAHQPPRTPGVLAWLQRNPGTVSESPRRC